MALTLPYPTMSLGLSYSGYSGQVDQFLPTSIHSSTLHNDPHAKLLANDIAIAAAVNGLLIKIQQFFYDDLITTNVTANSVWTYTKLQTTTTLIAFFEARIAAQKGSQGAPKSSLWLRATPVGGVAEDVGNPMYVESTAGNLSTLVVSTCSILRIITSSAGAVQLGYRTLFVDGSSPYARYLCLTMAEIKQI